MITTAGGLRPNEDRAGHRGSLAWVIDGATDLYDDAALPAERDVHWLVDFIAEHLGEAGARGYRGPAATLLDGIAELVSHQQQAYGFPADRLPPACSVALAVDQGDTYEITRIGDATAVVVTGERVRVLATDFFDRREGAAVHDQRNGNTAAQVRAAMIQRRLHTMTAGDIESVFSGHPRRRLRPHTIGDAWTDVDQILLCTDGFARLVSDYALYPDWSQVAADGQTHGLAYLEKLIRDVERGPAGDSHARFKRSDDVAAILFSPEVP
jgi:hypothetical protein